MKKLFIVCMLFMVASEAFSQSIEVTTKGIVDASNKENSYIVMELPGKGSNEIYQNCINYVNVNYKFPEKVIRGKVDNQFLSFNTFTDKIPFKNGFTPIYFKMEYRTEITIKDGKAKIEFTNIDIKNDASYPMAFSGRGMSFYIYHETKGLKQEGTKDFLEEYFNSKISSISEAIQNGSISSVDLDF